jgi:hypothetical protein
MEHAARIHVTLLLALPAGLFSQVDEGKVEKYFEFDPAKGVTKGAYPELTIEDLRKITLFSKLSITGAQVSIGDDGHMRKIEAHPRDPEVLVITSDHFRFTVLKNGAIKSPRLSAAQRRRYQFLWIKHATRESPDGKPWLKDLILLPYDSKTGKLAQPWPFDDGAGKGAKGGRTGPKDRPEEFFLRYADQRPHVLKLRDEAKSVAGTFQSGKASYLVLDVFGGYSWWGKVAYGEYFWLRGQDGKALDEFHGAPTAGPGWISVPWSNPRRKMSVNEVLGAVRPDAEALAKKLPALLDLPLEGEKVEPWADLLAIEEDRPVKAVDDMVKDAATLGDMIAWANEYRENRLDPGMFQEWLKPLEKALEESEKSYIVTLRVLRYAFRRKGLPAVIQGTYEQPEPLYPRLALHVYIPSEKLSWVLGPYSNTNYIFRPARAVLAALPTLPITVRGQVPFFDCHVDSGGRDGMPVPWGF